MLIVAIDPGPEKSAYAVLEYEGDTFPGELRIFGKHSESVCIDNIFKYLDTREEETHLAIEMPACYGMVAGKSLFDTCAVVGHFESLFRGTVCESHRVYRKQRNKEDGIDSVVMALCKNSRAKDKNVRQAIIDLYPGTGGGSVPQVGTKKEPGPLYGVSADVWAAMAVGLTYQMSQIFPDQA